MHWKNVSFATSKKVHCQQLYWWDSTKSFLPGINGYIEHNIMLDEIISQAKAKKKTMHITFFDLEDAFGSVPHGLLLTTMHAKSPGAWEPGSQPPEHLKQPKHLRVARRPASQRQVPNFSRFLFLNTKY